MDRDDTLGEYVRRLRRRKHWGLQDLANSASLSVSHLSRIENDGVVPNAETVVKLATALDGDLDRMLEMADCLPREIFERYIRRAGDGGRAVRRSVGSEAPDTAFPQALVEEMDPDCRQALARQFGLSEQDVDGLFGVLQGLAAMSPARRELILAGLSATFKEGAL